MILKILLLIAVVAAVYFVFFKTKPAVKKEHPKTDTQTPKGEETVECAACGAYVALDDAIVSNGKYYCSKECLNA
jgi:uncharacterized protein